MVDPADAPNIEGIEDLTPVGRGGFATVYRGRQPAFRREVAVKVLQRSSLDSDDRRRFERECQAMGALSGHPGIVTLYDAGFTDDGRPYLVMPFFPDGTLHDRLVTGPMNWQEVAVLGVQVAGALETAHRAGVVHRDVKPGNVLRSQYGNQISDFGIARLQGGHETQSGVVTASIAHAAPEILDGHAPSELADVYSLGSTLYQALVGRAAFTQARDETLLALVRRVLTEPVPDLRDRGVPSALATTVETAMAKDPGGRYSTAEMFGRALQHAQSTLGAQVTDLVIVGERADPSGGAMPAAAVPPPGTASATTSTTPSPQIPENGGSRAGPEEALVETLPMPDHSAATTPPPKRPGPLRWVLPLTIGGFVALLIAGFALWPRTGSDNRAIPPTGLTAVTEPASGTAPATSVAGSTPDPTIADESTTIVATTVAPGPSPPTAAVVATVVDIANTTSVDGFPFTGIDGISYDPARGLLLAAKEPAPSAIAGATPGLADPAVFAIPMDVDGSTEDAGLDFVSASAAPLTRADGAPYGPELDIEGMSVFDDGTFYVASEGSGELDSTGGPFVHRFESDGRFRSALPLPEWFLPDQTGTQGFTPRRGLHGIDARPGFADQVVLAVEAPLIQDHDPGEPTEQKVARLIAFDASNGESTAEWGYPLDRISPATIAARPNAASLIVDVARLDADSLVVLESTWTDTDTQIFGLYRVELDDGTAPSGALPPPLEKSPIGVLGDGITDALPRFGSIASGPTLSDGAPSLVLATDNAFADEPTQIMLLRLGAQG